MAPEHTYDARPRLLASLAAGLVVVRAVEHPLEAVLILALALGAIWGWP
jgi:hypothetical protein